jgi:hypothetical protein
MRPPVFRLRAVGRLCCWGTRVANGALGRRLGCADASLEGGQQHIAPYLQLSNQYLQHKQGTVRRGPRATAEAKFRI